MSIAARFDGDIVVNGQVAGQFSIDNDSVAVSAGIEVEKLEHLHKKFTDFGVAADAAPSADVRRVVFVASGACTVRLVKAVLRDCGTSTGVTFDLLKAPVGSATLASILSAAISFTHADTDNTPKSGTVSNATLAAGDMLVCFMDFTSATGALGPAMWVEVSEGAA